MAAKTTGISRNLLIHPGETISDILEERGISQSALATSTGVSPAFVSNVISGKKDISANFAMALEYALGVPKSFWLNLQANYDAELLEISESESITDDERAACKRLSEIVKYLKGNNAIERTLSKDDTILALRSALRISNIANLEKLAPQGAFRISEKQKVDPLVLGAWIRMCQIANEGVAVSETFDSNNTPRLVSELKDLMLSYSAETLQDELRRILAEYGIAFSIAHHFKGAPVHGYVSKRDNGSYQMSVTIRDAWEDVFWFSLFHEIGHIHNGDISSKRREYIDLGSDAICEKLADAFAKDALISPDDYTEFVASGSFTYANIELFADEQGVKPCIVVGRLQKDEIIPWSRFAKRKPRLKWARAV